MGVGVGIGVGILIEVVHRYKAEVVVFKLAQARPYKLLYHLIN